MSDTLCVASRKESDTLSRRRFLESVYCQTVAAAPRGLRAAAAAPHEARMMRPLARALSTHPTRARGGAFHQRDRPQWSTRTRCAALHDHFLPAPPTTVCEGAAMRAHRTNARSLPSRYPRHHSCTRAPTSVPMPSCQLTTFTCCEPFICRLSRATGQPAEGAAASRRLADDAYQSPLQSHHRPRHRRHRARRAARRALHLPRGCAGSSSSPAALTARRVCVRV